MSIKKISIILFSALFSSSVTNAADVQWDNASGGQFSSPGNWLPVQVPTNIDNAIFDLGATYQVDFTQNVTNNQSSIIDGNVTFDLGGFTYTVGVDDLTKDLSVGETLGDNAQLTLLNGTVNSFETFIGRLQGSIGTINVGSGMLLTSDDIFVGFQGDGTLSVSTGGDTSTSSGALSIGHDSSTAVGVANYNGLGTTHAGNITVGNLGTGTLNVSNAATLQGQTIVGNVAGSIGTINLDGIGSSIDSTNATNIGFGGTGSLNITNGAIFNNTDQFRIANNTGSQGTVTVENSGSSLQFFQMNVGDDGFGTLNVRDGGNVTSLDPNGFLDVAREVGSIGNMTVEDSGSSVSLAGELVVGNFGSASLMINNGGSVSNVEALIGSNIGSIGVVSVDNGTWVSSNNLWVARSGSGSLNIANGGNVTAESLNVGGNTAAPNSGGFGVLSVDGAGSTITTTTGDWIIGIGERSIGPSSTPIGSVGITSGANAFLNGSGNIFIGRLTNGHGELHLAGSGSLLNTVGNLNIAEDSTTIGNLSVSLGASLFVLQDINVGMNGSGTATINDNSQTRFANLTIGNTANATGSVTVDNFGQLLGLGGAAAHTYVGLDGDGQLLISNSGVVANGVGIIGTSATGVGVVTIESNGSWINTSDLYVGDSGNGTLTVNSGGTVTSSSGFVGDDLNSSGQVTLNNGSWTVTESLFIGGNETGSFGTGSVDVQTGGLIDVANELVVLGTTGTLNLSGGTARFDTLDISGTFNFNAGTLNFTDDFVVGNTVGGDTPFNGNVDIVNQQTIQVNDVTTIEGGRTLSINGGTFSTGSLVNSGLFQLNTGTFNLTNDTLTVGSSGLFGNILQVTPGQEINVSNNVIVDSNGILVIDQGLFNAGTLTNNGDVSLNNFLSRVGGTTLVNNNLVRGEGRIDAALNNTATGQVRVGSGESLQFTSAGNTNAGRIEAIGGEIEFTQDLTNQASTGNLVARDATLRFGGGIDNDGTLGFTFGTSDVFGDVINDNRVTISGGSNVTFFDDYINNGMTQVSTGSSAVFFGTLSGVGTFTGSGSLFIEGDLSPGSSPGLMSFGNISYGSNSTTLIEIAGLEPESEYDVIEVALTASLDGLLMVELLDEFVPTEGSTFDFLLAEKINGQFSSMMLPIIEGLKWEFQHLIDEFGTVDVLRLTATAVPLPPAIWLFASAISFLFFQQRVRANRV